MKTVMLDGSRYDTPEKVYVALAAMLSLPPYFGRNADALNDCLGEFPVPVSLWIASYGEKEVSSCVHLIADVFADNGGTVKEI
jgi:RNAse (barnase) inhibitor barstar